MWPRVHFCGHWPAIGISSKLQYNAMQCIAMAEYERKGFEGVLNPLASEKKVYDNYQTKNVYKYIY